MKKRFIHLLVLLLCAGCNSSIRKFALDEVYYSAENKGLVEVNNYSSIQSKEDEKASFAVFIYLSSCSSCSAFKPILQTFVNENNLIIYQISLSLVSDLNNTLDKKIKYVPSVALFNEGELATFLDPSKSDHTSYFKSVSGFSSWFNKYIIMP